MPPTSRETSIKAVVLTGIALFLLLPLQLLQGLVRDRVLQRDTATQSVARGWGDRQWVGGPVIAVPVTVDGKERHDAYLLPDTLNLDVEVRAQGPRLVGPYEVPVYVARIHATGTFDMPAELLRLKAGSQAVEVHTELARLLLPVSDTRGLRSVQAIAPAAQSFEPAADFPISTLAMPLSQSGNSETSLSRFDLMFDVAGTQSLQFLPLARTVEVRAHGNWRSPGFTDGFLPLERQVDNRGFTAHWQVLNLNRAYGDRWFENSVSAEALRGSSFGVEFIQPVDIYQRAMRSVKYGGLFIALSFLILFLFESLQRTPIHPVQYALMGLALSVFYLLLLALCEHIGFLWAYVAGALALCCLIGFYLGAAVRSRRVGLTAGALFAATYALLYLLVTAEDFALLVGALSLFVLLASVMLMTRNIDWYASDDTARR